MFRTVCLTLLALALVSGAASAQITSKATMAKGWLVSGHGNFYYHLPQDGESDSPSSGLEVCISPRVLHFIADGLGVGADLGLDWTSNKSGSYTYSTTDLAFGPRVAFYARNATKHYPSACCLAPLIDRDGWWLPFVGLTLQYVSRVWTYGESDNTASGFRGRLGVGVSPLIGTRGTMPVELGFQLKSMTSSEGEIEVTSKSSTIYLEIGFGAFLFRTPGT